MEESDEGDAESWKEEGLIVTLWMLEMSCA